MGRKKIEKRDRDEMLSMLIGMFVPENILHDFEVWDAYKQTGNWVLELREKEDRIPKVLLEKITQEIVFRWFLQSDRYAEFWFFIRSRLFANLPSTLEEK